MPFDGQLRMYVLVGESGELVHVNVGQLGWLLTFTIVTHTRREEVALA